MGGFRNMTARANRQKGNRRGRLSLKQFTDLVAAALEEGSLNLKKLATRKNFRDADEAAQCPKSLLDQDIDDLGFGCSKPGSIATLPAEVEGSDEFEEPGP